MSSNWKDFFWNFSFETELNYTKNYSLGKVKIKIKYFWIYQKKTFWLTSISVQFSLVFYNNMWGKKTLKFWETLQNRVST